MRCEQLAVDLAHGGELLARLGEGFVELEGALLGVLELGAQLARRRPPADQRKAERFIRTLLGGWAYGAIYRDSRERNAALAGWLDFYSRRRPHGALSHKPPIARLAELNNVTGSYIEAARLVHRRRGHSSLLYALADGERTVEQLRAWLDEDARL